MMHGTLLPFRLLPRFRLSALGTEQRQSDVSTLQLGGSDLVPPKGQSPLRHRRRHLPSLHWKCWRACQTWFSMQTDSPDGCEMSCSAEDAGVRSPRVQSPPAPIDTHPRHPYAHTDACMISQTHALARPLIHTRTSMLTHWRTRSPPEGSISHSKCTSRAVVWRSKVARLSLVR